VPKLDLITSAALSAVTFAGLLACSISAGAQTPASPAPKTAGSAVVATVNGNPITEAEIELAEAEIGAQLGQYPPKVRRKVLIEFLIENQLFAGAATASKVAETTDYKERLRYWQRRVLRDVYFENVLAEQITDADAKAFYNEKVANVKGGPEVKASHILVETEDKAKEIYEELAHGGDFAELAKKNSKDPGSKDSGGSLGYFGKGQMVPEFEAAAMQLAVNEVSLPVKSKFGWHIIKVEDKRERKPPPFEALKDRIVNALMQQKARETVKTLRQSAKIVFTDPEPASPARLPFTAAPPVEKK